MSFHYGARTSTRSARRQPRRTSSPRTSTRVPRRQTTFRPAPPQGGNTYRPRGPGGGGTVGPGVGGGGNSQDALNKNRGQRLAAALAAIKSDFSLQKGDLQSQLGDLKSFFNRGIRENERDRTQTQERVQESFAERGLFKSGLRVEGVTEALAPLLEQREDLVADYNFEEGAEGSKVRELMSLIKLLGPGEERAAAAAELETERERLEFQKFLSLTGAGLQGVG